MTDTNVPAIHRERRKPRFLPPPEEGTSDVVVNRLDILNRTKANAKPAFSRNRNIAGNLPEWSPTPPGYDTINRGGSFS